MMRTALKKGGKLPFSSTIGACCPFFVYFVYWGVVHDFASACISNINFNFGLALEHEIRDEHGPDMFLHERAFSKAMVGAWDVGRVTSMGRDVWVHGDRG